MNSQEGSSMGGSAHSLSLLIILEIRQALYYFWRSLATQVKSIHGASCSLKALTHSALHRLQTKPSHQTPLDLERFSQTEKTDLLGHFPEY